MLLEASQPKPRYAGWLLAAYLVPPVLVASAIAAESGATLLVGQSLSRIAFNIIPMPQGAAASLAATF